MLLIHFWGVRGSLPSPLLSSVIQEKLSTILKYAVPEDLANAESRKRFLAGLPPWLYGTVGGNTPCVSISIDGFNEPIIFDCGSGMREMGIACRNANPMPSKYHTFFSHFHWDHLQGLPFFNPAYDPSVTINFYSPKPDLEKILSGQMKYPYFPIEFENIMSVKQFHLLEKPVAVGPAIVAFKKMNHPGESFSYLVSYQGKRAIYATDTELSTPDFLKTEENTAFFKDADIIVMDSQYTLGEAIDKYNWGHSAFSLAVDFAANWGIKHLVLFHFDPTYDDRKLNEILQLARWYQQRMDFGGMEITLATEGLEISL
jgi:phosphoribosyl 1,2-cyclic phosphodiesterase